MRIQKAIQEGHLKFDNKMKLDGNPFPQNMVGFSVNMVTTKEKGKVKVLTLARESRMDQFILLNNSGTNPQGSALHPEKPN
jgi:hypothetical protein